MMPVPKYRPYFTAPELMEVISTLKAANKNQTLIRYLETFSMKIDLGIQNSNLVLAPTMVEKLELTDTNTTDSPAQVGTSGSKQTKEEFRFSSYQKWFRSPESCSPKELEACNVYRFEHGLMEMAEEEEYIRS